MRNQSTEKYESLPRGLMPATGGLAPPERCLKTSTRPPYIPLFFAPAAAALRRRPAQKREEMINLKIHLVSKHRSSEASSLVAEATHSPVTRKTYVTLAMPSLAGESGDIHLTARIAWHGYVTTVRSISSNYRLDLYIWMSVPLIPLLTISSRARHASSGDPVTRQQTCEHQLLYRTAVLFVKRPIRSCQLFHNAPRSRRQSCELPCSSP